MLCDGCGRDVTRYRVLRGCVMCYGCVKDDVRHRRGVRFNGHAVPLWEDHARNIDAAPPTRAAQDGEIRAIKSCARAGGMRTWRKNPDRVAQQRAQKIMRKRYATRA
jgi:hypothetical protein